MRLPDPYESIRAAGVYAFALPSLAAWVADTLVEDTLHGWASGAAEIRHRGRGSVPVARVDGRLRAVRHYRRGGAVESVLGDRYLRMGEPRPLRELRVSEGARDRGIPTPRIVAGAVYPAGPFYRADLVTNYLEDATSLADAVIGVEATARRHALAATRQLIDRMGEAGLRHPDLNATNILLTWEGDLPKAQLLDLDRASLVRSGRVAVAPMRDRLLRSLRKLARASGDTIGEAEAAALAPDGGST